MTTSSLDCGSQGNLLLKSTKRSGDDSPLPFGATRRQLLSEVRGYLELRNTPDDIARKTMLDRNVVIDLIRQLNNP